MALVSIQVIGGDEFVIEPPPNPRDRDAHVVLKFGDPVDATWVYLPTWLMTDIANIWFKELEGYDHDHPEPVKPAGRHAAPLRIAGRWT